MTINCPICGTRIRLTAKGTIVSHENVNRKPRPDTTFPRCEASGTKGN